MLYTALCDGCSDREKSEKFYEKKRTKETEEGEESLSLLELSPCILQLVL